MSRSFQQHSVRADYALGHEVGSRAAETPVGPIHSAIESGMFVGNSNLLLRGALICDDRRDVEPAWVLGKGLTRTEQARGCSERPAWTDTGQT